MERCLTGMQRAVHNELYVTRKPCCHKERAALKLFFLVFSSPMVFTSHYKLRCSKASIKQGFRALSILAHCVVCCGINYNSNVWGSMSLFLWM